MSAAPNQLVEIHRQLKEHFSSHQTISVVPIKGDPPDRYEITYNVKGLSKSGRGDVIETTGHVIELSIPFGFPHFPPSCKPKSDIFHPDFDPAAICLGEIWHQECQLPDLIIHIGRMIIGEFYSGTNAFNEEACLWYGEHPDTFPLAEIEWQEREMGHNPSKENVIPSIDTLDDNDLSTNFDFLSFEEGQDKEDSSAAAPHPAPEPAATHDLHLLNLLDIQKKYFTLYKSINESRIPCLTEDLHRLSEKAEGKVRKAEDVFRESKKREKSGDFRSAMECLKKIADFVEDFPDLEAHRTRLRQALAAQEPDDGESESAVSTIDEVVRDTGRAAKIADRKEKGSRPTRRRTAVPILQWNNKLGGFLLGGILALLVAGGGYYYWLASLKINAADKALSQCTALLEKGQFEDAKRSCQEALTASGGVEYFHKERVERLQSQTSQILQSEKMSQGLKGMILIDGRYLAKKDAEAINTYRLLRKEADDFYAQEQWQPALERINHILAAPEASHIISADDAANLETMHDYAGFRLLYDSAIQSLQNGKWLGAVTDLVKAEGLLQLLPEDDRQQYADSLKNSLTIATFEQSREQGDIFFAKSAWQEAMAAYERALSTPATDVLPKASVDMIHRNMKRAELYNLIDQGIKAFGTGAWDQAISDYRRAEEFLANQRAHLNVADAEKSIKKLSRIILQALIVRDREIAAGFLEKKELAAAGNIYRQLINHIDNSPFSGDGEFLATKKEFVATVQALEEKIFIAEKSSYLESAYQTLFAANYPTAVVENLVNPVISFTKDDGEKAIFKMQCTETGGGRPLTLVMYYAFDRKNGRWDLHSEQQ